MRLMFHIVDVKGEVQNWDRGRSSINIKSRFQLETTIRNDSLYFLLMLSKFIWV